MEITKHWNLKKTSPDKFRWCNKITLSKLCNILAQYILKSDHIFICYEIYIWKNEGQLGGNQR